VGRGKKLFFNQEKLPDVTEKYGRFIGVRYNPGLTDCDNCHDFINGRLYIMIAKRRAPQEYRNIYLLCKNCHLKHVKEEYAHIILTR